MILAHNLVQFNIIGILCAIMPGKRQISRGASLYDVIIVGAGPTGSYIAYRLASLGYKVAVFEEHERIGEPVQCTGIVGAECLERFPLFEGTVLGEVSSARLFSPSRSEIRLWRDSIQAYIIDRATFDQALAENAQRQGAHYLLGSRVRDVAVWKDRVRIATESQEAFEAKSIVIASGFSSKIPQRLGLGKVSDFVMGAQAEVNTNGQSEIEVYFDQGVAPGFFAWSVPTAEQKALVGLFSRRNPGGHLRDLLSALLQQGKIASPEAKITYGGIPLKPLLKTYRERVLVVGDAAGQVKPTSGGGVYYGLLCADVAADTLDQALTTNSFSEKLLSGYQKAWQERIGGELKIGYLARRFYGGLTNHQIDYLFRTIKSKGIHQSLLQSPELSFDWHSKIILKIFKHLGPWSHLFARGGKV